MTNSTRKNPRWKIALGIAAAVIAISGTAALNSAVSNAQQPCIPGLQERPNSEPTSLTGAFTSGFQKGYEGSDPRVCK